MAPAKGVIQHGLVATALGSGGAPDRGVWERLHHSFREQFTPRTPAEEDLVAIIASNATQLVRLSRAVSSLTCAATEAARSQCRDAHEYLVVRDALFEAGQIWRQRGQLKMDEQMARAATFAIRRGIANLIDSEQKDDADDADDDDDLAEQDEAAEAATGAGDGAAEARENGQTEDPSAPGDTAEAADDDAEEEEEDEDEEEDDTEWLTEGQQFLKQGDHLEDQDVATRRELLATCRALDFSEVRGVQVLTGAVRPDGKLAELMPDLIRLGMRNCEAIAWNRVTERVVNMYATPLRATLSEYAEFLDVELRHQERMMGLLDRSVKLFTDLRRAREGASS